MVVHTLTAKGYKLRSKKNTRKNKKVIDATNEINPNAAIYRNKLKPRTENQKDYIRVSPGFTSWCESPFHWTQDHYFIDHDGESWLVMLSLIFPSMIRKTMDIVADK